MVVFPSEKSELRAKEIINRLDCWVSCAGFIPVCRNIKTRLELLIKEEADRTFEFAELLAIAQSIIDDLINCEKSSLERMNIYASRYGLAL